MNIFKRSDEIETYTYPVVKIVVCVAIFMLVTNRNKMIPVTNEIVDTILIYAVVVGGFSCIINSLLKCGHCTCGVRQKSKTIQRC